MDDFKPDKSALDVFNDQPKNESQAIVEQARPRRPLVRDIARILIFLVITYHAFMFYHGRSASRWDHRHGCRQRIFGRAAEQSFLSVPNPRSAITASRQYATRPHLAGSDGDFKTAELYLSLLQESFGISPPDRKPVFSAGSPESQEATRGIVERDAPSAWVDTYYPVMNTPLERVLQIVDDNGTVVWNADLTEHAPGGDDTDHNAHEFADAVPTFHGLSISGDVTGHLVHGNYCTKDDYDSLVEQGAPLIGSIVLCRYGQIFRGLKVKGGQDVGAAGVLIYSDPRDDGKVTTANGYLPYPAGPARNPTSVQRGSVQFLSVYPGDPTTPGYPSYENSTRTEGTNIPSIPSLPISWANAEKLLETLESGTTVAGKKVRLFNDVDTRVIPIWNVMGVIPGHIKNEVVMAGNHRDAWLLGAVDPSSGTVSHHEVIRGFGHLLKQGWKPLRTIVFASWDAEEYGLIGSTEWGEDFADWIEQHVVAYFNLDSSASGSRFHTSGSPLLAHLIRETAQEIPHPTKDGKTLWDATTDTGSFSTNTSHIDQSDVDVVAADNLGVNPLGSGSDYTVFLQRAGIPSTDEGFGATENDPPYHYHSVFDSERWSELYGDPGFTRRVAVAKHYGLQIMRLANAPILPFNTTFYSLQLENYLDQVENMQQTKDLNLTFPRLRATIHALQENSLALDRKKHKAGRELWKVIRKWRRHRRFHRILAALKKRLEKIRKWIKCHLKHDCPHDPPKEKIGSVNEENSNDSNLLNSSFNYGQLFAAELENEHDHRASEHQDGDHDHGPHRRDRKYHRHLLNELKHAVRHVQSVNAKLRSFEHGFISKGGIKDREWFKHLGVAPGKWLGYGATTLPGLSEAIVFDKDATAAKKEAARLTRLLRKMIERLQE